MQQIRAGTSNRGRNGKLIQTIFENYYKSLNLTMPYFTMSLLETKFSQCFNEHSYLSY